MSISKSLTSSFLVALAVTLTAPPVRAGEVATPIPPPAYDPAPASAAAQTLVMAGGCFWGVQGVFQHVRGVSEAVSGYAGGKDTTAHYPIVSMGKSGHAEAVKITYDPNAVTLGQLLQVYFSVAHDPTQLNAQGPDKGTQYRSAIFVSNPGQERVAQEYIKQLNKVHAFDRPVVTRLEPLSKFYPAEDYHQDYLTKHPNQPYIVINDLPKIQNLKRLFPALYRDKANLVSGS
jgi:peptide-methionine (S)-S-oxide reductase